VKQGNESLFISPRRREEDDTLCTDLTKKSTVYVEIIFCFYLIFIKTALHKSSLYSGKKKKEYSKQRQVKEAVTVITITAFLQFTSGHCVLYCSLKIVMSKK